MRSKSKKPSAMSKMGAKTSAPQCGVDAKEMRCRKGKNPGDETDTAKEPKINGAIWAPCMDQWTTFGFRQASEREATSGYCFGYGLGI